MEKKNYQFYLILNIVLLVNFLFTTTVFFLAHIQGNDGVSLILFGGADDGIFYWEQAQRVIKSQTWAQTSIYPLIIGNLVKITGINDVYLIRIFNYLGFIMLLYFSLKSVLLLIKFEDDYDLNYYRINSQVFILISFMFYASLQMNIHLSILRDIWIYAFYVCAMYLSLRIIFQEKNNSIYIILLIPVLAILGGLRSYILISFLIAFVIYGLYKAFGESKHAGKLVWFLIIAAVGYYTFLMDFQLPFVEMSLRDALNYRMSFLTDYSGGSQMWINLDQPNIVLFIINYFQSFLGNLIGPLPWHISGISTLIVFVFETIPMVIMLYLMYRWRNYLTSPQNFLLLHAFVWIALIAVTNDNVGTGTRLRPVAWILILQVMPVLYYKVREVKRNLMKEGQLNEDTI